MKPPYTPTDEEKNTFKVIEKCFSKISKLKSYRQGGGGEAVSTNPQGRPPLHPREQTMRMGFCGLKKQWAALTAWGALTGKTFSEVMREAIDEYMKKRGL